MKRIISVLLVVCVMLPIAIFSVNASQIPYTKVYEERFIQLLNNLYYYPWYEGDDDWYVYNEFYNYYSLDNNSDIPDWVLAKGGTNGMVDCYYYGVFGDYVLQVESITTPYDFGYYIYRPDTDKFYLFEDMWEENLEGIEKVFTECLVPNGYASVIGDADKDGRLSILDATQIQLENASLVERKDVGTGYLCGYGEEMKYITDLDRDGKITVMDATAIQLKLAGL